MSYSKRTEKVRTNAPIINPYEAFTQPEFDDFISGLTDKIRDALDPRARHRNQDRGSDASYSYRDFSFDRSVSVGDSFRGGSVQSVPRSNIDTIGENEGDDRTENEDEDPGSEEDGENSPRVALPKVVVSGAGDEESPFVISDSEEENESQTPHASSFQDRPFQPEEVEEDDELEEDIASKDAPMMYSAWGEEEGPFEVEDDVEEGGPAAPSFMLDEEEYVEESHPVTSQRYPHESLYQEQNDEAWEDDHSEGNQLDTAEELDEYIEAELDDLPPEDSLRGVEVEEVDDAENVRTTAQEEYSQRAHHYAIEGSDPVSIPFFSAPPHPSVPSLFGFNELPSTEQHGNDSRVASQTIAWPTPEFSSTSAIGFYPSYPVHSAPQNLPETEVTTNGHDIEDVASLFAPLYASSGTPDVPEASSQFPAPIRVPQYEYLQGEGSTKLPAWPELSRPPFMPQAAKFSAAPPSADHHEPLEHLSNFGYGSREAPSLDAEEPAEPTALRAEAIYEEYPGTQSTTGDSKLIETSQQEGSSDAAPLTQGDAGDQDEKESFVSTRSATPLQPPTEAQTQEEPRNATMGFPLFGASQITLGASQEGMWDSQKTITMTDFPSRSLSIVDEATLTPTTMDASPSRPGRTSTIASDDYFGSQSRRSVSQEAPSQPFPTQETLKSDGTRQEANPSDARYSSLLDDDSPLSELEQDESVPVNKRRQNKKTSSKPSLPTRSPNGRPSVRELRALGAPDLALEVPTHRATRSSTSSPVVSMFSPLKAKGQKGKSGPVAASSAPKPPARKRASRSASHSSSPRKAVSRASKSSSKGPSEDHGEETTTALETVEEDSDEEEEGSTSQRRQKKALASSSSPAGTKRRRKARSSLADADDDEDYLPEETERSIKKRRLEAHELDVEKSLDHVDLGKDLEVAEAGATTRDDHDDRPAVNQKRANSETQSDLTDEDDSSSSSDGGGSEFQPSIAGEEKEASPGGEERSQATTGEGEEGEHVHLDPDGKPLKRQSTKGVKLGLDGRLYKPPRESDGEGDSEEEEEEGVTKDEEQLLEDVRGIAEGAEERLKALREERRLKLLAERAERKRIREEEKQREKEEKAQRRAKAKEERKALKEKAKEEKGNSEEKPKRKRKEKKKVVVEEGKGDAEDKMDVVGGEQTNTGTQTQKQIAPGDEEAAAAPSATAAGKKKAAARPKKTTKENADANVTESASSGKQKQSRKRTSAKAKPKDGVGQPAAAAAAARLRHDATLDTLDGDDYDDNDNDDKAKKNSGGAGSHRDRMVGVVDQQNAPLASPSLPLPPSQSPSTPSSWGLGGILKGFWTGSSGGGGGGQHQEEKRGDTAGDDDRMELD